MFPKWEIEITWVCRRSAKVASYSKKTKHCLVIRCIYWILLCQVFDMALIMKKECRDNFFYVPKFEQLNPTIFKTNKITEWITKK